ncbi:hypothetical protein [Streptomyces hiroshimensis]
MDTATAYVTVISIFVAESAALLRLWLRLRWRSEHELMRRQYLAHVTEMVAADGRLELDEQQSEGGRLRMSVSCAAAGQETSS